MSAVAQRTGHGVAQREWDDHRGSALVGDPACHLVADGRGEVRAGDPVIRGGIPSRMDDGSVTALPDARRTRVASSIIGAGVR